VPSERDKRRATLRDVAEHAGVSVQTVSNTVRERHDLMRPGTRERVERALRELGYHPNSAARGLRSSRTQTFAFLILDEAPSFLADPLTDLLVAGVADIARDRGYELLLKAERPLSERSSLLSPVLEGRVDGAFVLMSGDPRMRLEHVTRLKALEVPFVVFDEVLDDPDVLSVRTNERETARALTEHLIGAGHEVFAFVAARLPWAVVEQRHLGHREALSAAGVPVHPELERFEATWQADGGEFMAEAVLRSSPRPTAIVCGSDVLAIGAVHGAKGLGLRVPDDVAVAGFDDFAFSAYVDPPLTTVRVAGYEMGRAAAEMLVGVLGGRSPATNDVVLPNELIVRASA